MIRFIKKKNYYYYLVLYEPRLSCQTMLWAVMYVCAITNLGVVTVISAFTSTFQLTIVTHVSTTLLKRTYLNSKGPHFLLVYRIPMGTVTCRTLSIQQPTYLVDLLHSSDLSRTLRSYISK